jgi:hypothetical protein
VDVYLNGSHLSPADFTASNGSDVVLGVAASADDVCDIVSYTPFEVASQTFTGTTTMTDVVAATLDISGNIDIDGVTNLDVVDIDGAVDMASTLAVGGVVTANAGVVVDNFTLDGTTLALSSGNFTLDVAGDIIFDGDGADILFKDGGTEWLGFNSGGTIAAAGAFTLDVNGNLTLDSNNGFYSFKNAGSELFRIFTDNSGDVNLNSMVQDKDIHFHGNDGGADVLALVLDMSDAGTAIFNAHVRLGDNKTASFGAGNDIEITSDGTNGTIAAGSGNLLVDVAGDITLNADGGDWLFNDGSVTLASIQNDGSNNVIFMSNTSDKDIKFLGKDNTDTITALTLDMSNAGAATFNHLVAAGSNGGFYLVQDSSKSAIRSESQPIVLQTYASSAWQDRVTITNSGDLLVGKAAVSVSTTGFQISGSNEVTATIGSGTTYHLHDGSNYKFYVNANGGIYNHSSNNVNLSDQREKKNIEALGTKWDAVKAWSVKEFHYNADEDSDAKKVGVIAQDVETNHPELVTDFELTEDTTRKAVKEQQMMWMAIKALQEAQARIETLETKVAALEG